MKLYFSKGACSLTPRIIINELNLPCEYESVDLKTKQTQNHDNFLTINPKGSVPVLVTNQNEILTENAVILQYLADTAKAEDLLPSIGNFQRYRVLEWLNFAATELHKGIGSLFNANYSQEVKDKIIIPNIMNKLKLVDTQLSKTKFIHSNQFSLPDAYLFVVLSWAHYFKLKLQEFSHIPAYYAELKSRKSIQQSLTDEGIKATA